MKVTWRTPIFGWYRLLVVLALTPINKMSTWFYYDAGGQKKGPITEPQLKALAAKGIIIPDTPLETDAGHKGLAGQIQGLFDVPPTRTSVESGTYAVASQPQPSAKSNSFVANVQERSRKKPSSTGNFTYLGLASSLCDIVCMLNTIFAVLCILPLFWIIPNAVSQEFTFFEVISSVLPFLAAAIGLFQVVVFFYALSTICIWMVDVGDSIR